jgi:hypothetical protein
MFTVLEAQRGEDLGQQGMPRDRIRLAETSRGRRRVFPE